MKELKLKRTTHNGLKCYKDENKLYAVFKDEKGKYRLYRAVPNSYYIINELRCWGYEEINSNYRFNTLTEVMTEIEDDLRNGVWIDDYQKSLRDEYIY